MRTYLFLSLAAALLTASACKKDDPDNGLPPATQEGKNTFGCLVDGQPFGPKPKGLTAAAATHSKLPIIAPIYWFRPEVMEE